MRDTWLLAAFSTLMEALMKLAELATLPLWFGPWVYATYRCSVDRIREEDARFRAARAGGQP